MKAPQPPASTFRTAARHPLLHSLSLRCLSVLCTLVPHALLAHCLLTWPCTGSGTWGPALLMLLDRLPAAMRCAVRRLNWSTNGFCTHQSAAAAATITTAHLCCHPSAARWLLLPPTHSARSSDSVVAWVSEADCRGTSSGHLSRPCCLQRADGCNQLDGLSRQNWIEKTYELALGYRCCCEGGRGGHPRNPTDFAM